MIPCQIPPPIIDGFAIGTFSLQQQCQIEHCINVVRRDHQGLAQAFDRGFGTSLIIQQVSKVMRRSAGVVGRKAAINSRLRESCSTASANADRLSDRCPALPHSLVAFSISPASV